MPAEIIVAFQPVLHGFSGVGHCETTRIIRSTVREIGEQTSAELSAARADDTEDCAHLTYPGSSRESSMLWMA